jgi:hypothetical protein
MAGITALLNQKFQSPQGQLNQRLYQLAANPANGVFHDVTVTSSGVTSCLLTTPSMCNNSTPSATGLTGGLAGYLVTPGFDEVTGLGSIDAGNLLANWTPSATFTMSATPASQTISGGGTATFTITVTSKGNYTSPITFIATLGPSSAAEVSFTPPTITLNGGTATTTLTIVGATALASGVLRTSNNSLPFVAVRPEFDILNATFLMAISITGLSLLGRQSNRHRRIAWKLLPTGVLCLLVVALLACGNKQSQTYSVQITATAPANGDSEAVTASTVVNLTAQN